MSYINLNNQIISILNNEHIKNTKLEATHLYSNINIEYDKIFEKTPIYKYDNIKENIKKYLICNEEEFIATIEQLRLIQNNIITINNNKIYYNTVTYRKLNNNYILQRHPYFININDNNELINIQY